MKNKNGKNRKTARIVITGTLVLALTFGAFILPLRPKVSEAEKRPLARFPSSAFPRFSAESIFRG